jgi:gas vesicle protein
MQGDSTRDDSGGGVWFIAGILVGTAVGVGLGMLLAPKPGAELRKQVSEEAQVLRRKAADQTRKAGELAARGKELVERGREAVTRGVEEAKRATVALKDRAATAVDDIAAGEKPSES